MTDHDLNIARDIGELKADMRTVKHDVANIQLSLTGVAARQQRSLGFIAGAAFIITGMGSVLLALAKLLFGGHA